MLTSKQVTNDKNEYCLPENTGVRKIQYKLLDVLCKNNSIREISIKYKLSSEIWQNVLNVARAIRDETRHDAYMCVNGAKDGVRAAANRNPPIDNQISYDIY
jgi:hypothetical protein